MNYDNNKTANESHKTGSGGKIIKSVFIGIMLIIGFIAGAVASPAIKKNMELRGKATEVVKIEKGDGYVLTERTIHEILVPASDLITMRYYYTDADSYEDYKDLFGKRVPLTTSKVVFTYDGVISVGFNISNLKYDINTTKKKLSLQFPSLRSSPMK